MSLLNIKIQNLRNLIEVDLQFHAQFNLIFGDNGYGKTTFLEAIYLLSRCKSFRTTHLETAITHQQSFFAVFASLLANEQNYTVGLLKQSQQPKIKCKINHERNQRSSELSSLLPVLLINHTSHYLVEGGPVYRRQLVDWGVFHVKPLFYGYWQKMQRILKQRNAELKNKSSQALINSWNEEFASYATQLDNMRKAYLQDYIPLCEEIISQFLGEVSICAVYERGWPNDCDLISSLEHHYLKEKALGYTTVGPHRFDVKFYVNDLPAAQILSRGQQKVFVCALLLAQGLLLRQQLNKNSIFLIDDLPAELDYEKQALLKTKLTEIGAQTFITGINRNDLIGNFNSGDYKLFHVKPNKQKVEMQESI